MECLYIVKNMHMKHRLYFPTHEQKKRITPICSFFLTPVRSQYNAINVAGRSLACGGSKNCYVWQKVLVKEGMQCLSSRSEAVGQICHTFMYHSRIRCIKQS